jgi:hypothetical protein
MGNHVDCPNRVFNPGSRQGDIIMIVEKSVKNLRNLRVYELPRCVAGELLFRLSLANCYEGRYYRQIAPRKGDASPFLNGLGDSETIGAAKPTATKSAHTA